MKFSKEMMIKRVTNEGKAEMLDEPTLAIMDDLDGQECNASCWRRVVYGEPVYYVVGKSGNGMYVNEKDCY